MKRESDELDLLEFLSPNRQGRPILEGWLVNGRPIRHRIDVLLLAQNPPPCNSSRRSFTVEDQAVGDSCRR